MGAFDDAALFKSIVDQGSLAKAAESLGMSPSMVSKHLARLESSLGVQLLTRTTRRQYLTEAGRVFYQRFCVIEGDWLSSIEEVKSTHAEPKGQITVAVPQPVASRFLMPFFAEFQKTYPGIELRVLNRSLESLPCSEADISICRELEGYDSTTIIASPFYRYHNYLFAAPSLLASGDDSVQVADLSVLPCVTYSPYGHHTRWSLYKGGQYYNEISPNIVFRADNTEVLISAAVSGLGIAYIPEVIVQQELATHSLIRILPELESKSYRTVAYYQKMDFMPRKLDVFIQLLKKFYV